MALEPGFLLNKRYQVEIILGEGGMGAVYRAVDLTNHIGVAVKEFRLKHLPTDAELQRKASSGIRKKEEIATREKALAQFKREAELLAALDHPNLPKVTDYFEVDEEYYLVMTLIVGKDAATLLNSMGGKPLPERVVLVWMRQVMDALVYCHDKGVIHRDIKPANLILTNSGRIYLVDFGIAKQETHSKETSIGARVITPGYSPPEQYSLGRTDVRSDIYSLGATMYAMLTGHEPVEAITRLMGTEMPPPQALSREITTPLAEAVFKAISLQQEDRFQTIQDFHIAVFSGRGRTGPLPPSVVLEKVAVTPSPISQQKVPTTGVIPPVESKKEAEGIASGSVLPAAPKQRSIFQSLFGIKEDLPSQSVKPAANRSKKGSEVQLSESIQHVNWSPAGNILVILTGQGIYTYDRQTVKPLVQIDTGWSVNRRFTTLSPDGTTLAAAINNEVQVWSLLTRQKVSNFTLDGDYHLNGVVFMRNGMLLAAGASLANGLAKVWELQTKREMVSLDHEGRMVGAGVFSRSGKTIAVNWMGTTSGAKRDGLVKIWDLAGRREMGSLMTNGSIIPSLDFSPDEKLLALGSGMVLNRKTLIVSRIPVSKGEYFGGDHASMVVRVSFAPDGNLLATVGDDGTIKVWSLEDKSEMLIDAAARVRDATCVDFSPTEKSLAVGTASGSIQFFRLA